MGYCAHSKNALGNSQSLADHLEAVAALARQFADKFGCGELGYWAGLWHDLGKVDSRFQQKLARGTSDFVDHKGAGVMLASRVNSRILQFVIAGHHGGLVDPPELQSWFNSLDKEHLKANLKLVHSYMSNLAPASMSIISDPKEAEPALDLLTRMVFSALVDADFIDTENHFQAEITEQRRISHFTRDLLKKFDDYHQDLTNGKTGELNELRNTVYESCVKMSSEPPGFFRLTVPTGGGKTLSSLAFALGHSLSYRKERVIYAIPYTSIIEQTAKTFKGIFSAKTVLEHHTGIHAEDPTEYADDHALWNRLAAENWDAAIIVTTTVQLFESLFGRTPSICRKIHNMANSVIILDEVQTLPMPLFPIIMSGLKDLVQHFGSTVVFCTATQPALDTFLEHDGVKALELAPDPDTLFNRLKRVRYYNHVNEPWSWKKVSEKMRRSDRAMAVVNTRKDARELWETFDDDSAYHLSAAMCPAHRTHVLSEIRERLARKESCYLIATQVIEAGVDVDFDCVLRAIGPLDRIVQAAGRCNREGKLEWGDVIIFNPEHGSLPKGVYGVGKHKAEQLLCNPELDLNNPSTFPAYFELVRRDITERYDIEDDRKRVRFRTVAEKFNMIEQDTVNVVVEYKPKVEQVRKLVKRLRAGPEKKFCLLRELQPFIVSLPGYEVRKSQHLLEEIHPGLFYWRGRYHARLGLLREIDLTNSVI